MSDYTSISALNSLGVSQAVTAHNIANVSSAGFEASRAVLGEAGEGGGVKVEAVVARHPRPSENVPGLPDQETGAPAVNDVDLARELTRMLMDERAFEANAAALRHSLDTTGAILDLLV